jgi:hypothetical protein
MMSDTCLLASYGVYSERKPLYNIIYTFILELHPRPRVDGACPQGNIIPGAVISVSVPQAFRELSATLDMRAPAGVLPRHPGAPVRDSECLCLAPEQCLVLPGPTLDSH